MAGIGFELRKLYRKEGIFQNIKAYAYSSITTVGPMILCLILVLVQQIMMKANGSVYSENELFIATMTYCFVFSIILTSGLSMMVTRYIADMIYEKKYENILSSFYGSVMTILPISGVIAGIFLYNVEANTFYKVAAYLFFMELIVIWMQNIFLSALKDYTRIVRGFSIGVIISLLVSYILFQITTLSAAVIALFGIDVGFAVIVGLSMFHFEQVFPRSKNQNYFAFLTNFDKYPTIFLSGILVYSGVYIHNLIYWFFAENHIKVAGQFWLSPFYDVAVFYAYLSVLPSLVFFVVIIETHFYEGFLNYYKNVVDGGTFESLNNAKKKMQNILLHRIGFLVEIQLLFTTLSIALGIILLPKIGFTMAQLDLFLILCLAYFFFIIMFILLHILMYFDDQVGVLTISGLYIVLSGLFTYVTMQLQFDGMGMFMASFIALVLTFARLLYVLRNIDYYTFCSQPLISMGIKTKKWYKRSKLTMKTSGVLMIAVLLTGCGSEGNDKVEASNSISVVEEARGNDELFDDKKLYERDEDDSIKSIYMTVLPDNENGADWYGLNRITDINNEEKLKVIIAEGTEDETGPKAGMFGYGAQEANANISIRGNTARLQPQKSYKIKLLDNAGLWQNQRTINLNKHIGDLSRLRNKLSFDLMEDIPHITSLRTQFVHLYVRDLTAGDKETYEDYGLYTQIEQPNKTFLKNHLLDPNGYLYKVAFFEFGRYPEQIKPHTDKAYDKEKFETILEIKGREEHDKLIEMLNDVNDMEIPIDHVIDTYFDEENLLTWTAVNILMDNMDTDANNFYLYSPLNSEKWFLLPWDYDGGWELQRKFDSIRPYQAGISNFWGNILLNRYFRSEENVQKLADKIEELSESINEDTVNTQINKYASIVQPFINTSPDKYYLPDVNTNFDKELQQIVTSPERAKQRFYEDIEKPKPFYMWDVEVVENGLKFVWDVSFDLQNNDLYYSATIASDASMNNVVYEKKDMRENEFTILKLPSGRYFWKVTVKDSEGNTQTSFDMYMDDETPYYGIRDFEVQ